MTHDAYEKARGLCLRLSLISSGQRVTVALSGGADSMALTHILLRLREELGFTLSAAHLNHGLRGEESDRDEDFVRARCAEWGLPLTVGHAALGERQKPKGYTLEQWAREERYAFLRRAAQGGKIATAHTLSDQAETVLLHLARGAGCRGAGGIQPSREDVIRPLLEVSRAEIEAYCAAHSLFYVTDSTNADTVYARNRVRLEAAPALKKINPRMEEALGRFACEQRELTAFLDGEAEALLDRAKRENGYDAEILRGAKAPVLKTALARLLSIKGQPSEKLVALTLDMLEKKTGAVEAAGGVILECSGGLLHYRREKTEEICWEIPFACGEIQLPTGKKITAEMVTCEETIKFQQIEKKTLKFLADYDKILGNASLRAARPGDRYAPEGHTITKTMKHLRRENGIPAEEEIVVLAAGNKVFWAAPFGFSREVRLREGERPSRVLFLKSEE
ncbi:MAG: tRNA lysidine(34) synthetase TilS [Oscillospiraceae bacterium]|nr:tRNA lysidine(34) synthetase TilS [Oscillospiraceae bacterium]